MRTLIINTYGGSLLLGADAIAGTHIFGSYEDVGFGAQVTRANVARFRNLEIHGQEFFVDQYKHWPDQDLTDTIVLAHPPCAAFSQQNTSKAKRGVDTDAFECTRKVAKYAMSCNAAAIAIESVMGALGGAWDVHDHLADAGGYHVYRILKNSILFGVPQFRERFWCVFVRKGAAPPSLRLRLSPKFVTASSVLDAVTPGTPLEDKLDRVLDKFVRQLTTGPCRCGEKLDPPVDVVHGFHEGVVRALGFPDNLTGYKRQGFAKLIAPTLFPGEDDKVVCRRHVSPFTSAQPSTLAPGGFAPVLLGSSLWLYKGRPVSSEGYKAIMGFPTDYIFPPDRSHGMRTYLSKGVCPPVATWVLDNLRQHLGEPAGSALTQAGAYDKVVLPGHIASFRPSKSAILEKYKLMHDYGSPEDEDPIELRGDDEYREEEDQ